MSKTVALTADDVKAAMMSTFEPWSKDGAWLKGGKSSVREREESRLCVCALLSRVASRRAVHRVNFLQFAAHLRDRCLLSITCLPSVFGLESQSCAVSLLTY